MKIVEKENMRIVLPDDNCALLWQGSWVSWIAVPPAENIDAVVNSCIEYTLEQKEAIKAQEEEEARLAEEGIIE